MRKVVPTVALIYLIACAVAIGASFSNIPQALYEIFVAAFNPKAVLVVQLV